MQLDIQKDVKQGLRDRAMTYLIGKNDHQLLPNQTNEESVENTHEENDP